MKKARVLVVDDAMLIRRLVTDVLAADVSIEVVGEAANGRIALQKIAQLNPDLVTLDIEMPEMNGIQTLKEIRKTHPRLPVIMFSSFTERGAADTLEALHCGASDYVTKPASAAGRASAQQRIREDLVPKIRSICRLNDARPPLSARPQNAPRPTAREFTLRPLGPPITAAAIAVSLSTGGPAALGEILSRLPANFPAPLFVVPHMAPIFTRFLADRLKSQTPLAVVEAENGQVVRPGVVYVASGEAHLALERRESGEVATVIHQGPPENAHRPSADVLFRSVAQVYGLRALGLVLSGMGQDGVVGSETLARAGGRVIVQDEASSVVWEMPGLVASSGFADAVLPLGEVARELLRRTSEDFG